MTWWETRHTSVVTQLQYIPRNMHTVFALLCFVVVIHWLIFPYPSDLLHWHCGNLTIAPVPAKQPWWIWINTSCEFIMNDCITTTKQSTTKPCAYFMGYTVGLGIHPDSKEDRTSIWRDNRCRTRCLLLSGKCYCGTIYNNDTLGGFTFESIYVIINDSVIHISGF